MPTRGGVRAAAVADAKHFNKDYNEQNYAGVSAGYTLTLWPGRRLGRFDRSILQRIILIRFVMRRLRLKMANIPLLNALVIIAREATGSPITTNFDSIKQAVSSEIAKVVGGQTALQDRDEMSNRARNADSPEQLYGIFDQFTKLMGGQMRSLRQQYETGTYRKDFDRYLLPATQKAIASVSKENLDKYNYESPKVPDAAVAKMKDTTGKYWYVDKDNKPLAPVQ